MCGRYTLATSNETLAIVLMAPLLATPAVGGDIQSVRRMIGGDTILIT
ncbi:hypothetical protein MYX64_07305 [Nitrospinae bacterium AH_259_B05_G02_I21]|nr:hypothetical protein [Nitrospinae bacterium AH_259_B05_G02_I21]